MFFSFVLISIVVGFLLLERNMIWLGGSDLGGQFLKVYFLVTMEAKESREEQSLYVVPQVLTPVGPFGLNGVF